jgi:hypothetical protein
MKSILDRLVRLDYLIHLKATGNPAKLGSKIGISERSVYDYLRLMRELGAVISYSRNLGSYFYADGGRLFIGYTGDEEFQNLHHSSRHDANSLIPVDNSSEIGQ